MMENKTDYEDEDKQLDSSTIHHAQELILCGPTPSLEPLDDVKKIHFDDG